MADQGSAVFDRADVERRFLESEGAYKRLEDEAVFVLTNELNRAGIKRHSIASRIKALTSLFDKAERQQLRDPLGELKNIVGLRVVCLFLSDIDRVGESVRKCFDVTEEDNKIDGQPASSFGYMSIHFVARMREEYKGPRYDPLAGIRFEIQVRTIAMDAWAAASHYLDYKTDVDVPKELRKDFYALSGLFYVADRHFEMFARERERARATVEEKLAARDPQLDLDLNLDSLSAYLKSRFKDRVHTEDEKSLSSLVAQLRRADITSIKQLDETVNTGWDAFTRHERDHPATINGKYGPYADVRVVRVLCSIADDRFLRARKEKEIDPEMRPQYEDYRGYVRKNLEP